MFHVKTWLDVTVLRCPNCGHYYIDASWYVIEMESDIECGHCGAIFNSKKNATDRVLLQFQVSDEGKIERVKTTEHLELEK